MNKDPSSRVQTERLEADMLEAARTVMHTDDSEALLHVFQLVGGYAEGMQKGLIAADFEPEEANTLAWRSAWGKLKQTLFNEPDLVYEFATTLERGLPSMHPSTVTALGEPLDPPTRTFYQAFIRHLDQPAVRADAAWLYEA